MDMEKPKQKMNGKCPLNFILMGNPNIVRDIDMLGRVKTSDHRMVRNLWM